MRAAFVRAGGGVELRKVERPKLEKGSIIVKMKASGVCGTDLEKLSGRNITGSILGHEVSGVVSESDDERYPVETNVVPHHHVNCGKCELCKAGAGTMCQSFKNSNFVPGGFADEFLVPKYNVENGGVHVFGRELSFEEASVTEPLACCIRGMQHVLGKKGVERRAALKNVLVVGAGPIGLLHMELVRSLVPDVRIVAVDIINTRLHFAEKFENAETIDSNSKADGSFSQEALSIVDGYGYDLVVVATGVQSAFSEAVRCIRKSGNVLLFGAPHKGATHSLDLAKLFLDELTITSSYSATDEELSMALSMLEEKKIDVGKFITKKYPLENISEAMDSARLENQVKVVVIE